MTRETARDKARTWAEISLGNLEHNYRALREIGRASWRERGCLYV